MQPLPDTIQNPLASIQLGTGAWAWGDRLFWGYGSNYSEADCRAAFMASLENGIQFFDTAETYGQGSSESLLGEFVRASGQTVLVASKFMPFPWRLTGSTLRRALDHSLQRLGLAVIDLYQIHWPFPPVPPETWMSAMAAAVQEGLIKAVGVSNYNQSQTRRAQAALQQAGLSLASNQVEFHLLNRGIEKNGLLAYCRQEQIRVIAYSPLAQGLLTGKYHPDQPPSGMRGRHSNRRYLHQIQPLIQLLQRLGANHDGRTPAQVALNWAICKGSLPIPGAKNASQAQQNAGALGWQLTEGEMSELDRMSDRVTTAG